MLRGLARSPKKSTKESQRTFRNKKSNLKIISIDIGFLPSRHFVALNNQGRQHLQSRAKYYDRTKENGGG